MIAPLRATSHVTVLNPRRRRNLDALAEWLFQRGGKQLFQWPDVPGIARELGMATAEFWFAAHDAVGTRTANMRLAGKSIVLDLIYDERADPCTSFRMRGVI